MSRFPCKLVYRFQESSLHVPVFKAHYHEDKDIEVITTKVPSTDKIIVSKTTPKSPSSYQITKTFKIIDQGNLGDCVANAFSFCISVQTNQSFTTSRLYHYAVCRILDDTPLNQDNGTTVQTACNAIQNYGAIGENSYPYNVNKFANYPSLSILQGAKYFKKFTYTFVNQDLTSIKNCLNTYGCPIIFGFMVYSSFYNVNSSGIVTTPNTNTETLEGGHCMNIIGYNDSMNGGVFICANSWGTSWGKNGLCYIPYNYLMNSNLASDFCFTQFQY
jgi:C1A family cysteine protease